jgi:nitroreductase
MNPKLDRIFARRSVRQYKKAEVADGLIRDLLEAAMAAPSAAAKDPWHFVVVRDKAILKRITDGLPNGKMLADAAIGIVVCGDMTRAHGQELSYLLQDCSAAIENLLVAASALGLGACWLGVHPRPERVAHVRSVLKIPDSVIPMSVLAVGWPAEQPPPRTRYTDAAVHKDTW